MVWRFEKSYTETAQANQPAINQQLTAR